MCGVAGVVVRPGEQVSKKDLDSMARALEHRGPDDNGSETFGNVGLAHRRLSIIDLSPAGHQPMASHDGTLWVSFNGEIYNYVELRQELSEAGHRFRSASDTEVILEAYRRWGAGCLEHFNGIWAFALWDSRRGSLLLARDRLGVKPLYYWWDGRRLLFASEMKALLAVGIERRMDPQAAEDYLAFRFVIGERTLFQGVRKLLAGACIEVRPEELFAPGGEPRQRTWWDPPWRTDSATDPEALEQELSYLLRDAVELQLRSDVPVGCHLSGGLDSSTVTCLAAQVTRSPVLTFTGRFREPGPFDESRYAQAVVRKTKATPVMIDIRYGDLADEVRAATRAMDEPTMGWGVLPQMDVARECARHVKVVLGGQGGDELFGGYDWYRRMLVRRFVGTLGLGLGSQGVPWHAALNVLMDEPVIEKLRDIGRCDVSVLRIAWRQARSSGIPHALVGPLLRGPYGTNRLTASRERFAAEFMSGDADPLQRLYRFDVRNFLAGLLRVEDRTSMAFSLESRVPLLDHRIVEFASRLPVILKVPGRRSKPFLRRVAAKVIPPEIAARTDKQGFPTPLGVWLRDPRASVYRRYLDRRVRRTSGFLDADTMDRLITDHVSGRHDYTGVLWQALSLEAWLQEFDVAV